MNSAQIEANLHVFVQDISKENFIYDLLLAYGKPKSSITRLQKGGLNLSKNEGELNWKRQVFFKVVTNQDVHQTIEQLKTDEKAIKHEPRFIIVTNFDTLLAIDRKTDDTLDIPLNDIVKHYHFFLPWAGMEKAQHQTENPADVKAAERMAKLYDEIKKDNPTTTAEEVHSLNVFLSRLLFCFFAEDTGIFSEKSLFSHSINNHTQPDGSDLHTYLNRLFKELNTEERDANLPAHFKAFPYVNGGLFANGIIIPTFSRKSRQAILESGKEDWSAINPDIFGSMIQAVITPEHRGSLGMHYTSVPNIMKVIQPLFLDELNEEFEKGKHDPNKLKKLLNRIETIKIFDPACGSGNFLIIAYKELRQLELNIIGQLKKPDYAPLTGFEEKQSALFTKPQLSLANASSSFQMPLFSAIQLQNFYGIELDDFAHEIAILSLWLAQHQMNIKSRELIGQIIPSLPLRAGGNIVQGNACRLDWEVVCPKQEAIEIYILGNPPYLGARLLSDEQKSDMELVFDGEVNGYNDLDYIACWFYKGSKFIRNFNSQCAFVSTNSICQGSQVPILWPNILQQNIEIGFVYNSFKWTNNAKGKAAVIVIVLGIRNILTKSKFIYKNEFKTAVKNISPYLIPSETIYVYARRENLSNIANMNFGSMPNDGGHLILNNNEYDIALKSEANTSKFLKRIIGSKEFINDIPRWCIWIEDHDLQEALSIEFIRDRVEKVRQHRIISDREATKVLSNIPHRFAETRFKTGNSIIVPRVSSERRTYMPIGFLNENYIISDSAQGIYDADVWIFSMITSRMHMTWLRAVAGRLKSDYRYSTALCYNTFPFPLISHNQKQELEKHVYQILEEREYHSEKTLAQLYDPEKMPAGLREAHHQNDLAVERCYRSKPFESDEERLEYLFKLYEQMIAAEIDKGTLFETESKAKKKRK